MISLRYFRYVVATIKHLFPGANSVSPAPGDGGQDDSREISIRLEAIVAMRLFGDGDWLVNRETGPALSNLLLEMGLEERLPHDPSTTQSTTLGRQLNVDLQMAFMGLWEPFDMLSVLEEHGLIDADEFPSSATGVPRLLQASSAVRQRWWPRCAAARSQRALHLGLYDRASRRSQCFAFAGLARWRRNSPATFETNRARSSSWSGRPGSML